DLLCLSRAEFSEKLLHSQRKIEISIKSGGVQLRSPHIAHRLARVGKPTEVSVKRRYAIAIGEMHHRHSFVGSFFKYFEGKFICSEGNRSLSQARGDFLNCLRATECRHIL